jgi:hypothetical protein
MINTQRASRRGTASPRPRRLNLSSISDARTMVDPHEQREAKVAECPSGHSPWDVITP